MDESHELDEMDLDAQAEHQHEVRSAEQDVSDSVQAAAEPDFPAAGASKPAATRAVSTPQRGNNSTDAEHRRKVLGLELQRERILSERTSSPHRRSALASALIDIEEKLVELGWTLHL